MCAVTAVGVEELVDERMLQGEQTLIDWQAATQVVAAEPSGPSGPEPTREESSCDRGPRCMDIPLVEWTMALETVGNLPTLEESEAWQLKAHLRSLNVGVLLTVRAFVSYGAQRLAKELKEVLQNPSTAVT